MEATLKKQWKNHTKGTVIYSLSEGIYKELKRGGYLEPAATKKAPTRSSTRRVKAPPATKMVTEASEEKEGPTPDDTQISGGPEETTEDGGE